MCGTHEGRIRFDCIGTLEESVQRGPDSHHGPIPVAVILLQDPHASGEARLLGYVALQSGIVCGYLLEGEVPVGELHRTDTGVTRKSSA